MNSIIEIKSAHIDTQAVQTTLRTKMRRRQALEDYQTILTRAITAEPDFQSNLSSIPPTGLMDLNRALIELTANTSLREPQFRSDVPVLGPLIVRIRQFWNWMSTKWYVRPLIWQQSNINMRLASVMGEIELWQQLHAAHVSQLQQRVDYLEARLAKQQAELNKLKKDY